MDNNTPTNPTTTTQQPAPAPAPTVPSTTDEVAKKLKELDLSQMSEEDRKLVAQMTTALNAATAAKCKDDAPWYWCDYAKGVYTGLAAAALAVGGYVLYRRWTGGEA